MVRLPIRYLFLSAGVVWLMFLSVVAQEMMPIEKLGPAINTVDYDEASPVVSQDGQRLYFTRTGSPDFEKTLFNNGNDLSATLNEPMYKARLSDIFNQISNSEGVPGNDPYLSPYNQDIWVARTIDKPFDFVEHPPFPVNNALPNSVVSTALDSSKLVVINQFYQDGSMYEGFSSVEISEDGSYGFPQPMHIYDFYNYSEDVNLALSRKGYTMILSLKRKDSYGQNDLYVSFKVMENLWSTPKNIGKDINTPFQESTPFITNDGRRLYFSSDRPGSAGGMDIWVSERLDYTWKRWSEPKRLKEPVNSISDDSQAFIDNSHSYFYFSSRRDGSSDIFRMPLKPKPQLKEPLQIIGKLINVETGQPVRGEVFFGPKSVKDYLDYYHTHTGIFETELTEYEVYKFYAQKSGFKPGGLHFDARLAEKTGETIHEVMIYLEPLGEWAPRVTPGKKMNPVVQIADSVSREPEVGDRISFYNIYFERSRAQVLPISYPALDELVSTLMTYPTLEILIEGHTDNVGAERDLMELSWLRAKSVKEYLVEQGILADRIGIIGYGPQNPVADNISEEGRKKNRRVEVKITSK